MYSKVKKALLKNYRLFRKENNTDKIFISFLYIVKSDQSQTTYNIFRAFQIKPSLKTLISNIKLKLKLRGLSPHANYTDRAAAACRRS